MREAALVPAVANERSKQRLIAGGLALSGLSFAIVSYTANEEPFFVCRWSDVLLIVVLGTLVFALFATWAIACVRRLLRAPRRSALETVLVTACVLWTALNLFYLGYSIYGYADDLSHGHFRPEYSLI